MAGSAGLLSLGWQIFTRRQEQRTRLYTDAVHVDRTLRPGDVGYERALAEARERFGAGPDADWLQAFEGGTTVSMTNLSNHSVYIRGGGIVQDATQAMCAVSMASTEVKPRTTFHEFWIPDWWSVEEEGMELKSHPIQVFIDLDDGQTYYSEPIDLFPKATKRR